MSNREIAQRWAQPRVAANDAKTAFRLRYSYQRWTTFGRRMVERRCALRTANRRFRVHNGLTLKWS